MQGEAGCELQAVLERISDNLLHLDGDGRVLYASAGWERWLGFEPTQVTQIRRLVHEEDRVKVDAVMGDCGERLQSGRLEYRLRDADGTWRWLEMQAVPVGIDADGKAGSVYLLHRETTARHNYEERLLTLAYHDPLTGLPNRRLFREHLNQALAISKRSGQLLGVLYFDVNDFKRINDSMGHDVGDRFLQAFAARVRTTLREVDTFARLGGDEFAALLPGIAGADNMRTIIARIERALSAAWHVAGYTFKASASIGAAVYPMDGEDAGQLLKQADMKLYECKTLYKSDELSS
jgi:diguanylate cyclase (GGDEF)-like protein/PAS domain S-box-containing protein